MMAKVKAIFFTIIFIGFSFQNAYAWTQIKCDPIPLLAVPSFFDVLFYGGIEKESHDALRKNGHSLPSGQFHIVESFKGLAKSTKNIELYYRSKIIIITHEDFLIGGNYKDGKLYFANPAGTGCKSQKEILEFLRSPQYKIQKLIINPVVGVLGIMIMIIFLIQRVRIMKDSKSREP